ncbi:UDP-GlcNAc:undecaprenyl-phosphate GlcNAc-1-phosphate transferase [Sedimentibacter acidaminivorans]|jgi:UDP-GlcNAc:undecaprenyl-phosphate/decaprenyl-phosphate GlcNAc-1-phosphate transferase|uniref:UDP-GlcNAc:undecaprenyl-phosphate GlcNAc-1-phosphate transferase n=1 Tax=Sedimentibacter acidaminivorans TaxID=913099 RepID=A0ABS4GFE7_9FIRM|nr:MraY family glycosyltransferase [Sedimentibacter acidaminivorans]MBP1926399.1 UDP-GlcNAc:undecaprenyl-phosphate GlcNAc-1-phosphate transferase [Sedimentibacter acidaminivorans]
MNNNYIAFFSALIISFLLTPLARKLAFKVGALDIPKDARKIHNKPMPYFGGIAIYVAIMACMFVYMPQDETNISIMIGATIIVLTGIIDDMYGMPAKIKLIMQIVAAAIAIKGGVKIHFITNPLSNTGMSLLRDFTIPITLFWIVGITNTINLIDGLDGLASGVASIAATTLLFTAAIKGYDFIVMQCAIIAGASLGFLPFNFNPAKIFMGDTGSLLLGYMLAVTAILGMVKSVAAVTLVVPIFALGLPIFDTTFAIIRRFINKKPIMEADKDHLHHKLMGKGLNQRQTVLVMYLISMMLGLAAVIVSDSDPATGIIVVGFVIVIVLYLGNKIGLFAKKLEK